MLVHLQDIFPMQNVFITQYVKVKMCMVSLGLI